MNQHTRTAVPAIEALAASLHEAERSGQAVTAPEVPFGLKEAYAVQALLLELREGEGEWVTGRKLGFTSEAKMAQMGVSELIVGFLTDAMAIEDGGTLDLAPLIHPRVEPEVAFRLGADVRAGAGPEALEAAVDAVAPALEIIDSRYRDFRFNLAQVVADNTSATRYVLGPWSAVDGDLSSLPVVLSVDGATVAEGTTSDILGGPLRTLPRLASLAAANGYDLAAGSIILAGAATAAVALTPGSTVRATVAGLGEVGFTAAPAAEGHGHD
jgi:2-oxo-3-hexenedioate decarboxylase